MKPLVLYCSRTGNTAKVASAMAAALGADLAPAQAATPALVAGRPLIGLASGIYWARHDKPLFRAAALLPRGAAVFVVSTSGFRNGFLQKVYTFWLLRRLRRQGCRVVRRWHCPGHDKSTDPLFAWLKLSKGRPDARDLASARQFAQEVAHAADI